MVKRTAFVLMLFIILLTSCSDDVPDKTFSSEQNGFQKISIYSWNNEYRDSAVVTRLKSKGVNVTSIYQGLSVFDLMFSSKTEKDVKNLEKQNIKTSYLIGDPHWNKASTVITWALKPLTYYNSRTDSPITDVVLDIENYADPQRYLTMVKDISRWCHENNIKVTVCIPFWFALDNIEVFDAADRLSVCVFSVGNEVDIVRPLYELSMQHDTPMEVVLETQVPNSRYKVKACNTYNGHGIDELFSTISGLKNIYPTLNVSVHHLTSLLEF